MDFRKSSNTIQLFLYNMIKLQVWQLGKVNLVKNKLIYNLSEGKSSQYIKHAIQVENSYIPE